MRSFWNSQNAIGTKQSLDLDVQARLPFAAACREEEDLIDEGVEGAILRLSRFTWSKIIVDVVGADHQSLSRRTVSLRDQICVSTLVFYWIRGVQEAPRLKFLGHKSGVFT